MVEEEQVIEYIDAQNNGHICASNYLWRPRMDCGRFRAHSSTLLNIPSTDSWLSCSTRHLSSLIL